RRRTRRRSPRRCTGSGRATAPPERGRRTQESCSGEGLAAAAGALRVGVVDREPRVLQAVLVVERGPREVLGTGGVDDHAYALAVDLLDVVGGLLAVEENLVGEARTAARTHGDAKAELRLVLGLEELLDLGRSGFGENDHLGPPQACFT